MDDSFISCIIIRTPDGDLTILPDDLIKCRIDMYDRASETGFMTRTCAGYIEFEKKVFAEIVPKQKVLTVPAEALDRRP